MAVVDNGNELIRAFGQYQIARGRITRWWTSVLPHEDAALFHCELRSGELRQYRITRWELDSSVDGLARWLDVLGESLELTRSQENAGAGGADRPSPYVTQEISCDQTCATITAFGFFDFRHGGNDPIWSHEADEKARQLFINRAGREAHDTLNAGGKIALHGSAGGRYWMEKQHSYCIQSRPTIGRGKRYCAVVPGVPIWDHLLGIKTIIEADEPTFLRTANRA